MDDGFRDSRAKRLGFRPQKELDYNRLLPYADRLDDESERLLQQIRTNLAKAVVLKELKPGCALWTARLTKYLNLYGLKFSKECHIEFIQLVYELIIIPDLEPTKLHKFCSLFVQLTKKVYLISPTELTLQWRPLYETAKRVFSKSTASLGMFHYLSCLESTFGSMVQYAKVYFPPSATREILDEFLPMFLPWHYPTLETIQDLTLFLPYQVLDIYRDCTINLWLDDFMLLWKVCHNSAVWEPDMMSLMANVAKHNIGFINWEPHVPLMFTKFLRSLNLPVTYRHTQNNRQHSIDITGMSTWIVSTLGSNSSTQNYLNNFMSTITTYLHGPNSGKWSSKLRDLLKKLPIHFVERVHRERSSYKTTWETKTPESHRLTEEEITRFVQCVLDVALQSMFSRFGINDICISLQHLALLRPAMVIVPVLEKFWGTLDSLTEPHRLPYAMQCVVAVSRPLTYGFTNGFPEGPTHVIPLLFSCLPGLDPNDCKKMFTTLHFISVFTTLVPLVDCSGASEYWPDLTEEEHTVCEASAQFEDFVMQYLDKLFVLIESSSMEHTRMEQREAESTKSRFESTHENALASCTVSILMQTSDAIFKLALKKMFNFVSQRYLELNVAAATAASVCKAFAKVNGAETFKLFIPYLCDEIHQIIRDNENILKEEEHIDKYLLYNMLLLSNVIERNGVELLPYVNMLIEILDKTIHIVCKEGYTFVCTIIKNMLASLSIVHPGKFRSSGFDFNASVKDVLAIREWGKPGNIWKLDMKWHIPNENEVQCVQRLLNRFLPPELDKLNKYITGTEKISREELNKSLCIIKALLTANSLMPVWENKQLNLFESSVPWESLDIVCGTQHTVSMPDGSNIRQVVSKTMHKLQKKLLDSNEDDTKSLVTLISIWELLMLKNNIYPSAFENHVKVFSAVKRSLEDKLKGRPGHLNLILAERALLLHEFRTQEVSAPFTESQAEIMMALFALATSRYSEVRSSSQSRLNWIISTYAYSFKVIVPSLVECLQVDPEKEHERLKGALYCLVAPKHKPVATKHEWSVVGELWPALINSIPSEKPSVIRLMDLINRSIIMNFPTITINLNWSDACIEKATSILTEAELSDPEFIALVEKRDDVVAKINNDNKDRYLKLLDVLVDGASSTTLNWRHSQMCMSLLPVLVHLDIPYPPKAVKLVLNGLIHDSIVFRRISIKLMVFILKQHKRSHKKVDVDVLTKNNLTAEENEKLIPGFRPDNEWLQYDKESVWRADNWNNDSYIHKNNVGFYFWPKSVKMYSPLKEQPEYTLSIENFNETEKIIYDFFMNEENVEKLINFLSMEDKKGRDKFNALRFGMYKGLFSNYLDAFLPIFLPHLERLLPDKQESLQRCASEIIAGIIRSTKHWPYDKMANLQEKLTPLLNLVIDNMTSETFNDWGTAIATGFENRSVKRLNWILNLFEERLGEDGSSALICGRLFLLQAVLSQHPWTLAAYSKHLFEGLQGKDLLSHPYQIVRDRISSVLTCIFEKDIVFPNGTQDIAPSASKLIESIAPQMDMLFKEGMRGVTPLNHSLLPVMSFSDNEDMFTNDANNANMDTSHPSEILVSERLKKMLDSISKSGIEKKIGVNSNINAVNKLIQDVKNIYTSDNMKDFENGISSPIESFISNTNILDSNNDGDTLPFMEMLEAKLSSALKVSEVNVENDNSQASNSLKQDSQNDINIRLFKTVLKWVTLAICKNPFGIKSSFYILMPPACTLGAKEGDEELYLLCSKFLSSLAESLHNIDNLTVAFSTIEKVCQSSNSWCARVSCISFMQSLVFHNIALILNGPLVAQIRQITLNMMEDPYPEVREAAAAMMAGLLHCGILSDIPQLLEHFKCLCKVKIKQATTNRAEALARRHCGVLGLCAFIASQPYTVPSYLPEIFLLLGRHLNDPLPIPSTIRKTIGDFKRTHLDNWQTHQSKFTEEELSLLSDISVPPSYYA